MYTFKNRRFRCNAKLYKMGGVYYRYYPLQKSKIIAEHICLSIISIYIYIYIKNIVTEEVSLYMCIGLYVYIYIYKYICKLNYRRFKSK